MKKGLSQKQIKQIILGWEEKFPVNEWQILGIFTWPYIRIKLYIFLLNLNTEKNLPQLPNKANPKKETIINKAFKDVKRIISAKLMLSNFFYRLQPKKILFFGSHFHRTRQNGIFFNRFFDAMVENHQLEDEVYMIEFEKVYEKNYNQKAILPLHKHLDQYKLINKLKSLLIPPKKGDIELNQYETFYKQLLLDFPEAENLNLSATALNRWAQKIRLTKGFFINLYKHTKPEKIIFLSYYGYDDLAAAIFAAHELGIQTVDFQHGPQTNVHMAYSSWTKHPEKPYNIMPVEYWNWDLESQENIQEWAGKTAFISARAVGHPYMAYCMKTREKQNNGEKIFFSLQTLSLDEMLPPALIKLMANARFKWVLRMHPRSNFTKKELEVFLMKNRVNSEIYVIQDSIDVPLTQALAGARLHVTNFSGCLLEARMLGVPTILIHESGKDIFKNYIDEKKVFYMDPAEGDFGSRFTDIYKNNKYKEKLDYSQQIFNPLL